MAMKSDPTEPGESEVAAVSPPGGPAWRRAAAEWCRRHPVGVLVLVSVLAVMVNCYPVVFCGRSFVSLASATPTVFDWWPPAPGMDPRTELVERHESDSGAIIYWGIPVGFIESRSLWEYGELPLWNRYSHAGDTLIGQGVSMLGDPLQLMVILGHGSAVAWDLKFLVAKVLFCVGLGWLILVLLGSRPMSLLYAVLAAYCGAFFFIENHPVFFVFSYAPWILLSAVKWLDREAKGRAGWALVWLLANVACFCGGHLEPAVDLIGGLNLAALAWALGRCRSVADGFRVLAAMAVGAFLFVGLTAPVWLSFLAALPGAYSVHHDIQVTQLSPACLPGLFDDQFFLLLIGKRLATRVPGTSLLVLTGCILSLLNGRQLLRTPFFRVNLGALVLWGGIVFGWVPRSLLAAIPLLNRVGHTHTDFGYLLVIHLMIQSAFGFQCLARETNAARATRHLFWTLLIFAALFGVYALGTRHEAIPWSYFLCAAAGAIGAPWLFVWLRRNGQRVSLAGWCGIVLLAFLPHSRFGLYTSGNGEVLLKPGPRSVLNAPLPSLAQIQRDNTGPFRVVGLNGNFAGGDYPAVYGLEDIRSCAPLSNAQFMDLVRDFPGMHFDNLWRLDVVDADQARPLLNLLNVKYLLGDPKKYDPAFRGPERRDFKVLENPDAWPRAFFADKIVPIISKPQFVDYLIQHSRQPFIALSGEEIAGQPGLQRLAAAPTATIAAGSNFVLRPNSTAFDIQSPSAGMVCLTEGQSRDFTATANGQTKAVLTVNQAFKGIYLDQPGRYHIEFKFRPRYWGTAILLFWISALGILILAALNAWSGARGHKNCGAKA
jgi:hypothetical protein